MTAVKGTVCSIKNVYRQNTNIAELLVGKHKDLVKTDMFLQNVKQSPDGLLGATSSLNVLAKTISCVLIVFGSRQLSKRLLRLRLHFLRLETSMVLIIMGLTSQYIIFYFYFFYSEVTIECYLISVHCT